MLCRLIGFAYIDVNSQDNERGEERSGSNKGSAGTL